MPLTRIYIFSECHFRVYLHIQFLQLARAVPGIVDPRLLQWQLNNVLIERRNYATIKKINFYLTSTNYSIEIK